MYNFHLLKIISLTFEMILNLIKTKYSSFTKGIIELEKLT